MRMGIANLDMYRKVPVDLLEGTKSGSILSILALITILTLFTFETLEYLKTTQITDVRLNKSSHEDFRINFNITLTSLKCQYAVIDVVSVWGEDQNISQNVNKFEVDSNGIRQRYHGRNNAQKDILHYDESVEESIEDLEEDGVDAVELTEESFDEELERHRYVFVDFCEFLFFCKVLFFAYFFRCHVV